MNGDHNIFVSTSALRKHVKSHGGQVPNQVTGLKGSKDVFALKSTNIYQLQKDTRLARIKNAKRTNPGFFTWPVATWLPKEPNDSIAKAAGLVGAKDYSDPESNFDRILFQYRGLKGVASCGGPFNAKSETSTNITVEEMDI